MGAIGLFSLLGVSASLINGLLGAGLFTLGALRGLPDFFALPDVIVISF
jgi:hypothetical protein